MDQFLREAMFYGEAALETLAGKHVMVFGIGGVGSYTAEPWDVQGWGISRLWITTPWALPT